MDLSSTLMFSCLSFSSIHLPVNSVHILKIESPQYDTATTMFHIVDNVFRVMCAKFYVLV